MIHDGDDVGEALAGSCSRGENVIFFFLCGQDGIGLMSVKLHGTAGRICFRLADAENFAALRSKNFLLHQIINAPARGEGRIELQQGFRPEKPRADADETPRVVCIVMKNDFVA